MPKILLILDGSGSVSVGLWKRYVAYASTLVAEGITGLVVIADKYEKSVIHVLDEEGLDCLTPAFGPGNEADIPKIVMNYPYLTSVYLTDGIAPLATLEGIKARCVVVNVDRQTIHHDSTGPSGNHPLTRPLLNTLAAHLPLKELKEHN